LFYRQTLLQELKKLYTLGQTHIQLNTWLKNRFLNEHISLQNHLIISSSIQKAYIHIYTPESCILYKSKTIWDILMFYLTWKHLTCKTQDIYLKLCPTHVSVSVSLWFLACIWTSPTYSEHSYLNSVPPIQSYGTTTLWKYIGWPTISEYIAICKCIWSQHCFSKLRIPYFHHSIQFYWLLGYMPYITHFRCLCQKICLLFTFQILKFHNSILIHRVQWVGVKSLNVVPKLQSLYSVKHCIKPLNSWFQGSSAIFLQHLQISIGALYYIYPTSILHISIFDILGWSQCMGIGDIPSPSII
jgi:hypothetical protein